MIHQVILRISIALYETIMSDMTTSNVPEKPHQPASFSFPQRFLGKKVVHRSFQLSWLNQWKFLHYDESRDIVFLPHTYLLKRI